MLINYKLKTLAILIFLQGFDNVYQTLSAWKPSQNHIDSFFKDATEWIKLYLSLGGEVIGYENTSVTPYFHILAYHLPRFIRDETPFKLFTGQGVEKMNDTVHSIYHNKCNKHDTCKEAILALKKIEHLQDVERQPHQYTKKKR